MVWLSLGDLFTYLPPAFQVAFNTALIISLASLINMAVGLSSGIITMSRNFRFDSASSLVLIALNALLNWIFILRMGIEGAAWSTLVSLAMVSVWRVWYLWNRFQLWPYNWRTLFVPVLILCIGLGLRAVDLTGTAWLDIGLRSVAATILYWPLVIWLRLAPEVVSYAHAFIKR